MSRRKEQGFFREAGTEKDEVDNIWEAVSRTAIVRGSLWTPLVFKSVAPVYRDMVSESGVGSGSVVAVR
jgi:hypothetical protein